MKRILLSIIGLFVFLVAIWSGHVFILAQPGKAQPELTAKRSLEVIDKIGAFGPHVYLIRARSCYYLVVTTEREAFLQHAADCPSPIHKTQ